MVVLGVGMLAQRISARIGFTILGASWALIMLMNLMTLPIEFEASNRAKRALKKLRVLYDTNESDAVGSVLWAMPNRNARKLASRRKRARDSTQARNVRWTRSSASVLLPSLLKKNRCSGLK